MPGQLMGTGLVAGHQQARAAQDGCQRTQHAASHTAGAPLVQCVRSPCAACEDLSWSQELPTWCSNKVSSLRSPFITTKEPLPALVAVGEMRL